MNSAITRYPVADFRVHIARPSANDGKEFLHAMRASREFHYPWVSAPCDVDSWLTYLNRLERENEEGFLVRRIADHALCGVINLNIITYEALCSAYLSYYAVKDKGGYGYMKEGLQLVVEHAFSEMGLHRLEANIQPGNEPSIRLVESVGFECEGYSPKFLRINGKWRDHERWALVADHYKP